MTRQAKKQETLTTLPQTVYVYREGDKLIVALKVKDAYDNMITHGIVGVYELQVEGEIVLNVKVKE